MSKPNDYDLFNNPMVDMAKKALSAEQQEEYKAMGQYMYNAANYTEAEHGPKVQKASDNELFAYASQALRSGLNPNDLSGKELSVLHSKLGDEWYNQFGFKADEVPALSVQVVPKINVENRTNSVVQQSTASSLTTSLIRSSTPRTSRSSRKERK